MRDAPAPAAPAAPAAPPAPPARCATMGAVHLRRRAAILALALLAVAGAFAAAFAAGRILPAPVALAVALAAVLVLPGWALLRAADLDGRLDAVTIAAASPAAGLVPWAGALAVAVAAGLSLDAALVLVAGATAVLLASAPPRLPVRPGPRALRRAAAAVAALIAVAVVAGRWQTGLQGDALFHAGRVRKLVALPELSLSGVSTYADGALHAGYPFPVLHAAQAGAIRLARIDASAAYPDLAPAFAIMVALAAFAAGRLLAGSAVGAIVAILATWEALTRSDGPLGYAQQPASFTFLVLFPLALGLLAAAFDQPRDRRLAAAALTAVALVVAVHNTYALPLVAMAVAGAVACRRGVGMALAAVAFVAIGYAAVYWAALAGAPRAAGRTVEDGGFALWDGHAVALSAGTLLRDRPHVVLVLLALPALLLVRRGRHGMAAAFAGGALALVALPFVTTAVVEVVGAGQARRMAAAVPWPLAGAVAVGVAAAELRTPWLLAASFAVAAASLAVALVGTGSGWALAVAIAVTLAVAALVAWRAVRGEEIAPRAAVAARPAAAVLLLAALLSGAVLDRGGEVLDRARDGTPAPRAVVSPGLVSFLRGHDGGLPVVLAPARGSRADGYSGVAYQLVGRADVYAVAIAEAHSRAEPKNHPAERRRAVREFFSPAASDAERRRILRRYDVDLVVVDAVRQRPALARLRRLPGLREAYADARASGGRRYVVFAVAAGGG
jgi:hypothetical protein